MVSFNFDFVGEVLIEEDYGFKPFYDLVDINQYNHFSMSTSVGDEYLTTWSDFAEIYNTTYHWTHGGLSRFEILEKMKSAETKTYNLILLYERFKFNV